MKGIKYCFVDVNVDISTLSCRLSRFHFQYMRGYLLDDCEGIRGEGGAVIIRKANDHLVYIRASAFDVVRWTMNFDF